jgi:hypothetical protein
MAKKTFSLSPEFDKATANALATAKKELENAAKAHRVKIDVNQMVYVNIKELIIVHAPIDGIDKYKDSDFEAGAPIQLLIVKSTTPGDIPNSSYLVKAKYSPPATSGKAIFTDRNGAIVKQGNLIIRTKEQLAVLYPELYSHGGGVKIPTITSIYTSGNHVWVDCAGWIPYRVIIYAWS